MHCQNGLKGKNPQKPGYEVKARNLRGELGLELVCTPKIPPNPGDRHGSQGRPGDMCNA